MKILSHHTPGPWHRRGTKIEPGPGRFHEQRTVQLIGGQGGAYPPILFTSYCSGDADQRRFAADMHLVGAAPQLLQQVGFLHDTVDRMIALYLRHDTTFLPSSQRWWGQFAQTKLIVEEATGGR